MDKIDKIRLTENPNTLPDTLDKLSYDDSIDVRYYVTINPNTAMETLDRLLADYRIRFCVRYYHDTPNYIKKYLHYFLL